MGDVFKYFPSIPTVGEAFRMMHNGNPRVVTVTHAKWDEENQELEIIYKPAIGAILGYRQDDPEDGDEV